MFLSDEDILKNIKISEQKEFAFSQLIKKYQHKVHSIIIRMVLDRDDANDITQDVFIKCWNKINEFRGDAQLYTWLFRIATNESINFLKQKRRKVFVPFSKMEKKMNEFIDNSENISGNDIQNRLQKALLKLPDKQRLVFNLRYYDEMEYKEMSEVLGTSEGALKASYHHAVKKIEKLIFIS